MSLPITRPQAVRAVTWLKACFGDEIRAAVAAPFSIDHICAIACQETAYFWLPFIDKMTPSSVLARCVLDATGNTPQTAGQRNAFPKNTAAFRAKFGSVFTDQLIEEGNKTRIVRGFKPWSQLYNGYGIFQYDLQFVLTDRAFFENRMWYDIRKCLDRCMGELRRTYARHGTIPEAIRAYNGSGPKARQYRDNVLAYSKISATC
ncbi:MAG: hypothetical protein ACOYNN_04230 [Terrimicrobiaceae bacterium]